MIFFKTVASGNDFIHVNLDDWKNEGFSLEDPSSKSLLAKKLCLRHAGAGADGVVFYKLYSQKKTVEFRIFNCDGGEAELSGNGMGGLTALLYYLGYFKDSITFETLAGEKINQYLHHQGNSFRLKIDIGLPDFNNKKFFPFIEAGRFEYRWSEIEETGENIVFYPVSVGNPHVVIISEEMMDEFKLERIGKSLENAKIFPFRTNVEIIIPLSKEVGIKDYENGEKFKIYYYERGVGPTLSSSTGSSAAYSVLRNRIPGMKKITIPIGDPEERIIVSGGENVYIESTIAIIYKGVYLGDKI